jgi:hypothetical protein
MDWQVSVVDVPELRATRVFVYRDIGANATEVLTQDGLTEEITGFDEIKPIFTLSYRLAQQVLSGLADAVSRHGITPKREATIEGELTATKYHLEDLRHLLKIRR